MGFKKWNFVEVSNPHLQKIVVGLLTERYHYSKKNYTAKVSNFSPCVCFFFGGGYGLKSHAVGSRIEVYIPLLNSKSTFCVNPPMSFHNSFGSLESILTQLF